MKNWYTIQAKADQTADISIFDEIGAWGVTAKQFIGDLKALDKGTATIKLAINSPGGSVFDALAMLNALRQHPAAVEVTVMGVAASAASLVAMAGDKIVMPDNTFMMIHNPLNFAYGNADDLREMADVLDKIGASLVATYVSRTGQSEDKVKELLDAETWLNAEEAVALGFADELQPALKIAAAFDMDRLPDNVRASIALPLAADPPPEPKSEPEDDHPLDAAALSLRIVALAAESGLAIHADAFLLDPAIKAEADAVAAIAEAKEVVAVCAAARLPEISAGLIKARVPLATVRQRLQEARAALDAALPINHLIPSPTTSPQSASCSIAGIYAARRKTA